LSQKTILVTGATAGFGAAFARRFIADGHRVIATGRRVERLAELAKELGDNLLPAALDVTDPKAVAGFLQSLPESWQKIDVLVNNAGLALGLSPAWEADLEQWDTMIATNVSGLVHVTHAILPAMVERNDGILINIGSAAGYEGTKSLTPEDIAETASWLISLPAHVNINKIEMMPTCQASAPLAVKRGQ
jgi:3-hydroxy acid dehydrogenase/malonic semialdehyde reductase